MNSIEIPKRLEEWSAAAGYTLTPGSAADDGRPLFWSTGGELRYYITVGQNSCYVITGSDRGGPEHLELAASSWTTIEKYLYGDFGDSIRFRRRLPAVDAPTTAENLAPGYSLSKTKFSDRDYWSLIGPDGTVGAVSRGDEVSATLRLVQLALYLTFSIDDIIAASTNPDGSPLYTR